MGRENLQNLDANRGHEPGSAGILAGKFRAGNITTRRQGCRRSQGGFTGRLCSLTVAVGQYREDRAAGPRRRRGAGPQRSNRLLLNCTAEPVETGFDREHQAVTLNANEFNTLRFRQRIAAFGHLRRALRREKNRRGRVRRDRRFQFEARSRCVASC